MPSDKELKLIKNSMEDFEIEKILKEKFDRYGFGKCEIINQPNSKRIVVYVANLSRAVEGGKKRILLEEELKEKFKIPEVKIEFRELEKPFLNAYFVARRIGKAIENGINYKVAAHYYLDKIMESGAVGALINISGKIIGKERSSFQKFKDGYILHSGNYKEELVDEAHYRAQIPHGVIGITVKILREAPIEFVFEKGLNASTETKTA